MRGREGEMIKGEILRGRVRKTWSFGKDRIRRMVGRVSWLWDQERQISTERRIERHSIKSCTPDKRSSGIKLSAT
jgi:hypothetical protein